MQRGFSAAWQNLQVLPGSAAGRRHFVPAGIKIGSADPILVIFGHFWEKFSKNDQNGRFFTFFARISALRLRSGREKWPKMAIFGHFWAEKGQGHLQMALQKWPNKVGHFLVFFFFFYFGCS
eukprot:NODE_6859_length_603_cov_2.133574_g5761_i1.p1 GENE.NODE_6859_length_603_cov_2.133574_g5761_i1~~NODE_6859_length_603_cov_2.133574_g5761_i1.p1  ORF type:complete len:122 (+),score=10.86 NODE_6859_length_603_cov_2.133574_g5761_i1:205-570(+)